MRITASAPSSKQLAYWASLKGKIPWNKGTKGVMKPNSTSFKKGLVPWNKNIKGTHFSPDTEFKEGNTPWSKLHPNDMPHGENHHAWKGDKVGYFSLHNWIKRELGEPFFCTMQDNSCKGRFEWSNISRKYKRDLEDWMPLCTSHHTRIDRINKKKEGGGIA